MCIRDRAQLVFKRHDRQGVALAGIAIGIGDQLWHHEQADAAGALARVGQAGQHQMADVGRKIIVGPGDICLLYTSRCV